MAIRMAPQQVDCMACLVAAVRMRAADPGCEIILENVTHSAYVGAYGVERLTCQFYRAIGFRMLWYDAVVRTLRGLPPRTEKATHWLRPPIYREIRNMIVGSVFPKPRARSEI